MSRPGFTFLACPDAELIRGRIDALAKEFPASGGMGQTSYERRVFWGEEGLPPAFWEGLTLQSLMGAPKLLVVRQANKLLAEHWRNLVPHLSRFHEQAWPMFCLEVEYKRNQPSVPKHITKHKFWTFAHKQGWVWQSPGLDARGLREMISAWAKAKGLTLERGVLDTLVEALPLNAAAVHQELAKLELAAQSNGAVDQRIAALVSFTPDMDVFAFIDALQRGTTPSETWRKILKSQLSGEEMCFSFLAMVLREARILWQLLFREGGVRLPQRVLTAKQNLAKRLGPAKLARIWDLAWEAELGVKSGERSTDQALERLVAGLTELFRPPPSGYAGARRPFQGARP
ncbi:MAG: DNA polymerase III subunit delta [Desulfovibrio sp.]|nr:MAG: DNA polymerase III subunit delta [Desulfovibrio sp.]